MDGGPTDSPYSGHDYIHDDSRWSAQNMLEKPFSTRTEMLRTSLVVQESVGFNHAKRKSLGANQVGLSDKANSRPVQRVR